MWIFHIKSEERSSISSQMPKNYRECTTKSKRNTIRGGDSNKFIPMETTSSGIKELPDIDNEKFRELRVNDAEIDKGLDILSGHIAEAGEIAKKMGIVAKEQGQIADGLIIRTDNLNDKLETINNRLAKMIKDVRKADRFIIDNTRVIDLCRYK
ncbi:hypothetical protein PPL_06665 [Heterostelium album PN500]|uniref:t-SNARE coiled-coil homology domain-containing protein n=1 Tax=Heterostelium pallidum (strain ATCC 26659 / Pp 5 / PN500) TaxID=670386 RepID=D3BFD2_HETP5|nr:hypothetical protein PPL_06665 [Heterostelium album PN500]EFA79846.1 hypothetical protein PPL_06665 [Heterostelium album PN500]|eukprot:XP_020431967.1 hypothetical protein PPL_06665 [Heterostelium album PN500]